MNCAICYVLQYAISVLALMAVAATAFDRVHGVVAWYDAWVGVFVDRARRRVYVFPVPMLGVYIQYGKATK